MKTTLANKALPILGTQMHLPRTLPHLSVPMDIFPEPAKAPRHSSRHKLPSVWMRAGTSKGLFIHRRDLPASQLEWSPVLLSAMGSKDGDRRQLNGIGGASSTTSKVGVVEKSRRPGIDVDYTFVQVALNEAKIDTSGNCGNIASGVGPFALDEGLVSASHGQKEIIIRIFNTNTGRVIQETIQVDDDGLSCEDGDFKLPGLPGSGSPIKVTFIEPAGSMTGKLFPTGQRQQWLDVRATSNSTPSFSVRASLIDAANPFVWIDAAALPEIYRQLGFDNPGFLVIIENIRKEAAVQFGLASDLKTAALTRGTPKIGLIASPRSQSSLPDHVIGDGVVKPDILVTSFSMGRVHPSVQLTGAICLAVGVSIPGTVPYQLSREESGLLTPPEEQCRTATSQNPLEEHAKRMNQKVRIAHASGNIDVDVGSTSVNGDVAVEGATVYRTARRLFEGKVNIGR